MARADESVAGITRVGGTPDDRSAFHIVAPRVTGSDAGRQDKPSVLMLDGVTDAGVVTTYYLWVDHTGDLRIGTAYPTNQDSDGAVVGGQS